MSFVQIPKVLYVLNVIMFMYGTYPCVTIGLWLSLTARRLLAVITFRLSRAGRQVAAYLTCVDVIY